MSLTAEALSFRYNGTAVLEHVDLTVEPGELMMILGPNGVGKTTLLKCLNVIHRPRGGTIVVENRDVLTMKPAERARRISYVPQRTQTARLNVFDTVLMGRKPYIGWRAAEQDLALVDATLTLLGLDGMALRYIDELSGGELQKVVIARALVQEPRLLLLDEPTSSLDLQNQLVILSLIRTIVSERRIAAVMTMHDLNSALRYGDRFCFLKDGQVFTVCSREELTGATIEQVYGVPVSIHRIEGQVVVIPDQREADVRAA